MFRRKSRSIVTVFISRRKRVRSVRSWLVSGPCGSRLRSMAACLTQARTAVSVRSSSRATCPVLVPLACTSPTTSALYSVVNFRRFRRSMDPVSITLEVSTNSGQAHMRTGEPSAFPEPERPLRPSRTQRVKRLLLGRPKNLQDPHLFRHISLIAFLAWVGLGADGLSSSAYGPEEAFKNLVEHTDLAVFLAAATAFTVMIIAAAYSRVIEHFPFGGGGSIVASRLLGPRAGVVSGSALIVDYVLTISISIAAGGDALVTRPPASPRASHPVLSGPTPQ